MLSRHPATGYLAAVSSAVTFGLSGPVAQPLLLSGWSPAAVVLARIVLGTTITLPFALRIAPPLRTWTWQEVRAILVYGAVAIAGTQFCSYSAVARMEVAPALLIQYSAPIAILAWLWFRHGHRPPPLALGGCLVAFAGLAMVLGLFSGVQLDRVGVIWASLGMVGTAIYFLESSNTRTSLPPLALVSFGLVLSFVVLGGAGLVGAVPLEASTSSVTYLGTEVAYWVPLVTLGILASGFAYVTGVVAARRLGARTASFVALLEVVSSLAWVTVLSSQGPTTPQWAGCTLILAGIILIKLVEPVVAAEEPALGPHS
ncbi:EamA family transporter [Nocardioides marmoriginsengisoli]|uniref:EamA family transporter n=1 Tax=Nocardioides marmoriginsengisoli TaxID=661483 RepID=UPI0016165F03|nr:DMT family transporter [Nocardioides marmoriginsengisoli]